MEQYFVVGNVISQVGLVTISGYFVKRWMDRVDANLEDTKKALQNNAVLLANQIEGVHVELKLANGRTAKLEGKVEVLRAVCDERHET